MGVLCAALALPWSPAGAAEATRQPALPALEGLVRQWLNLRAQTAQEDRAWQEQQRSWQRELDLLEEEKSRLEARLHAVDRERRTIETEYDTLRHERDGLRHAMRAIEPLLNDIETHLRSVAPLIPTVGAPDLRAALTALTAPPPAPATRVATAPAVGAEPVNVTARLQRALALLTEVETVQNTIHTGRELIAFDGKRRELDVLYIGLAGAYACSSDGSVGAVGTPAANGWQWRAAPEVASEVRAALRILDRAQPARWLHLPASIEETP